MNFVCACVILFVHKQTMLRRCSDYKRRRRMNLDMYKALWEPIEINGVVIKNRISMSPMGTFA